MILKRLAGPILLALGFALLFEFDVQHQMVDFDVYRRAATRAAHAEDLYRPDDGHYQFKYLPAFAFPMRPLAVLDAPVARAAWYAFACALLVMLLRWSVRALPERNLTERALILLTAVAVAKFYWRELHLGQTDFLLGALLIGALLAAQVDARRTAGVLVGCGVFVKVYAVILIPWLFLAGGIPALLTATLVIAVGLLLPASAYGWQGNIHQLEGWFRTVTDTTTAPNLLNLENVSAASFWTKWAGFGPHVSGLALVIIVPALVIAALVISRRKDVGDPLYLEFGLLTLLIPVISPQGWDYLLLLATPAMVVLIDRWQFVSVPWRVAAGTSIALVSFTFYGWIGQAVYGALMNIGVLTIGTMVLVACLANLRMKKLA